MRFLYPLLLAVPLAIYFEVTHGSPVWLFISSSLAIVPRPALWAKSTEEPSLYFSLHTHRHLFHTSYNLLEKAEWSLPLFLADL